MSIPAEVIEFDAGRLPVDWACCEPGPELAARLGLVDWSRLSDRELVDAMDAARRQVTWTQSLLLDGVGELSRRRTRQDPCGDSDTHRRLCGEVSLELMVTTGQAEDLVAMATTLPDLPHTHAAMRTGRIDYGRAAVMVYGLAGLGDELTARLDADLAEVAARTNKTMLRHRLSRAIKKADPDAYTQRTRSARRQRRVEIWDNEDDTCDLVARHLTAADAHAIRNRLTAAAKAMQADGDTRPIDHIRLDLARDLLRGMPLPEAVRRLITEPPDQTPSPDRCEPPHQPAAAGRGEDATSTADESAGVGGSACRTAADEVIAAAERQIGQAIAKTADQQLSRLLEQARAQGRLDGLTELIGQAVQAMREALIPIVAAWCRATDGTGTTNSGQDAQHGPERYRPPARMQRLIQTRHATCVFPRCNRPSSRCDLDHTEPYDQGGRTCKCNLAPLCRAHHRVFKQHRQWTLTQPWPGLLIWVAPAGTWHIVLPQ